MVLGSGALQIGQAGEFDYSGSQALKALNEEGIVTVLVNPNIATIQTSRGMADRIYLIAVTPEMVEKIIVKESVDAILLSFGGQTALNCGLALYDAGILAKHGVQVLGTPVEAIRDTEDRRLFVERLAQIDVKTARSRACDSPDEARQAIREIGLPAMLRGGFALGGKGSGIVRTEADVEAALRRAFAGGAAQVLVEEGLEGWKEIEYEVVRDARDNCMTVCNMENFDPMGIHTGDSIVVAPCQTLDDAEHQMLRSVAIRTIRHLGIVGECNIQFALDPSCPQYRVIEVNARLSRSSALASKATGYPLAYVAAKLALGYALNEIPNGITRRTTAFFEPALDYLVCKFPRWDLAKFYGASTRIGSEMKSVGEVMAIGRTFAEVIQKAIRMLDIGVRGLDPGGFAFDDLREQLRNPTPLRIFAIAQAIRDGIGVDEIHELTKIDRWFLRAIEPVVAMWASWRTALRRCPPTCCAMSSALASPTRPSASWSAAPPQGPGGTQGARHRVALRADRHDGRGISRRYQLPLCDLSRERIRRRPFGPQEDPDTRLGHVSDRGQRGIRLVWGQCGAGCGGAGLRDHHAEPQPGDGQHRLRHLRPAVLRRDQPRDGARPVRLRASRRRRGQHGWPDPEQPGDAPRTRRRESLGHQRGIDRQGRRPRQIQFATRRAGNRPAALVTRYRCSRRGPDC